jgi:hypothetical protein
MKITDDFIQDNGRINIISNKGNATPIPPAWNPVLSSCDFLVVIPDMHMYIRNSPLDNFKFGAEAMLHFLGHLGRLKDDLALDNKTLRIYQLGDIYELRFPSLAHQGLNATAAEIRMSHPDYDLILNTMDHMRTHILYGNHDFEHRHFPGFRLGAFEGSVYLEHGFLPSPFSENPNQPLWEAAQFGFKTLREIESFFLNIAVNAGWIRKDDHYATGVADGAIEQGKYPAETDYPLLQRNYYTKRLRDNPDGNNPRICIIGHTHHPYLYLENNADSNGLIFADAGAWTEGRSDFVVVSNEEIAICHYKRA